MRTDAWTQATEFYEVILGLPIAHRSETPMGFEMGAFCLYLEKAEQHGPVSRFGCEGTHLVANTSDRWNSSVF
jgi:catechol 2,3-dioxygenase-like lactoylglutathione lyase family enzyme